MRRCRSISVVTGVVLATVAGLAASGCAARDPNTPDPAQASVASADGRTLFDPLVRPVTIGWLPDGMVHNLTRISTERYELTYQDGASREPGAVAAEEIHLWVWPPDLAYWQQPGAEQYEFTDTAPVNGKPAQWRPMERHIGFLRWEYRPRSWAELDVRVIAGDPLDVARRIAESMRFEPTERVRLPWRLTGMPTQLSVSSLQVIEDNSYQPWRTEIAFEGAAVDSSGHAPLLIVRAHKGPVSPDPAYRPTPNTTVHGHPALLEHHDGSGDLLYVYGPDDIVHEVYASTSAVALLGPGGLGGVAARFELLGEPPTWTDRPLA